MATTNDDYNSTITVMCCPKKQKQNKKTSLSTSSFTSIIPFTIVFATFHGILNTIHSYYSIPKLTSCFDRFHFQRPIPILIFIATPLY